MLDVSEYPYEENKVRAQGDRRLGLCGVAGLGSTLAMMGVPYDSQAAQTFAEYVAKLTRDEAYRASIKLATEKGPFPNFDSEKYCQGKFIKQLPADIIDGIRKYGIRNLALLTIPPVGTGSLLAGNISNGLEPIFALEYERNVRQQDGSKKKELVEDYAWKLWKESMDPADRHLAKEHIGKVNFFKTSMEIDPESHIKMQAILQKYIDGSISKTCNLPADYPKEKYESLLWYAYENGLKGFTTFREGSREAVLTVAKETKDVGPDLAVSTGDSIITINTVPIKATRPRVLDGKTYQIKEEGNHRTYCTLNYVIDKDGTKKPWEIFLYSSSRHSEWYAAIGRLASRIMRKTGDVQAVIDELMEIGGENGYLTQEYGYIQSKPQHIAKIIEEFVFGLNESDKASDTDPNIKIIHATYTKCPQCEELAVFREGGCEKCLECGWSKCG